jgi:condensin complex subunit 1
MDVDENDDEDASTEEDDDDDDEDSMSVDGEEDSQGSPKKNKKKSKKRKGAKPKRRRSELNFDLTQEQAAVAALEADQLLHLKLKKKYYAEAMQFIQQLDAAMDSLKKLLGSKNKVEVLETMEFFRVANEYLLKGAKVSSPLRHKNVQVAEAVRFWFWFVGGHTEDDSSHLDEG